MRRLAMLCGAALLAVASYGARAEDRLTLQLNWLTHVQFAGYYVAKDKGFYRGERLDVTIKPGGPEVNPSRVVAEGGADLVVDWLPAVLALRAKGVPLVNIAQVFKHAGLALTCRRDSGIRTPADFKGKTIGVWYGNAQYPFLAWMRKLQLTSVGDGAEINVLKQGFSIDPLLQRQAACISTMTYNEYWQLIDAGMQPGDLKVFNYEAEGVGALEDGIYALDGALQNPAGVDRLARFLRSSVKGWRYAATHQAEAIKIVRANDFSGAPAPPHQAEMMAAVAKLLADRPRGIGYLDPADFRRTVAVVRAGGGDAAAAVADGAWTHEVWDKAFAK